MLALASVGLSAISTGCFVAMVFSRQRGAAGGRTRVYYDEQYLVSVRHFGEWNDIRDFVQPQDPSVLSIVETYGPDYWNLFDYVCRNISYRRDFSEFWQFPQETLRNLDGDCEDTSILLCSMLQNSYESYVVLGNYCGYGHAWCELNGAILESTYTKARLVPDPLNYCPYVYFNEREIIELWPGAFNEIYELPRREASKLREMASVLE